jgi:Na+-translocating ferredoxin:NAD+ oxidoreductase RnfC subunit
MSIQDLVKKAGVVGAGGAGFPTHVKVASQAEWFLANGAECEPLLHKDTELMTHFAHLVVDGLSLAAQAVGSSQVAVGVKAKNRKAIEALQEAIGSRDIQIAEFGDFYPSGDEYEVVHTITGRLIPPAGIPLDVGVVVNNVETLLNIGQAVQGIPVTETYLTVAGLVRTPKTLKVPVGMRISEVLELAGGATADEYVVMDSGLMMGKLVVDLEQPVTKTTAGLIVLPLNHTLVERYSKPPEQMARIGKSACDQCSYCTELCPRYLLGYNVQPHAVMRSLGFTASGSELWNQYAQLCCGCGICTLYACPEGLYPREACLEGIVDLKKAGRGKWEGTTRVEVHPMKEFRRVPMKLLVKRLGVGEYDTGAPWDSTPVSPSSVDIPLSQHMGSPAVPIVKKGESVRKGQMIAEAEAGELGAPVHASISGLVTEINGHVHIEGKES